MINCIGNRFKHKNNFENYLSIKDNEEEENKSFEV
jgi:hypothetical protein